jgi:ferritin-like metal-binding protein YciE
MCHVFMLLQALSRRLAAAFPAAASAVVHLEIGEYGKLAPPGPA